MRKVVIALVVAANAVLVLAAVGWASGRSTSPSPAPATSAAGDDGWAALDAAGRCVSAAALVRRPNPWPVICRWREPGEGLRGISFPPPVGEPPWDRPRIEVYVGRTETRADVAHTIAHELGHMTHTREATFGPEWIAARGMPPDTTPGIWTEDYAEVFATLYGPEVTGWGAPTTRPGPDALARLQALFFTAR